MPRRRQIRFIGRQQSGATVYDLLSNGQQSIIALRYGCTRDTARRLLGSTGHVGDEFSDLHGCRLRNQVRYLKRRRLPHRR